MSVQTAVVSSEQWQRQQRFHFEAVRPFTSAFRERRGRGVAHPIDDFLFTYYTYSPGKLERWHPGFGVVLEAKPDLTTAELRQNLRYQETPAGISLAPLAIRARDLKQLRWVRALCQTILSREPRFSCLGLHEWAMVYRTPEVRHQYPLRLSAEAIADLLHNTTYGCSHFDAFRFSSPAARGLNVLQPTAETRLQHEQGGCLHANMDLYKWSYKLSPIVSSDLVRECFLLAVLAREIDMRASPYDFSALGYVPIKIETPEGQAEYREAQRKIAERSVALRRSLLAITEQVLAFLEPLDKFSTSTPTLAGGSPG